MNNLTIDELQRIVPAAFADEPADTVSERYSFISSRHIIDECIKRGWYPTEARQSKKVADQRHATHMITFRNPNAPPTLGDVFPQITLINNHAAMHKAKLPAGFFRLVCHNGLIVGVGISESLIAKVHIDDADLEFEKAFQTALERISNAVVTINEWNKIELNWLEQQEFAMRALLMKNYNVPEWANQYDAHEFLTRRRDADRNSDLWTVFNVVQENMLKGGVHGIVRATRGITQVNEIERINIGLWQLAEEFGKLHSLS